MASMGRVLLIDDDPSLCEALSEGLEPRGWSLRATTSPAEALAMLASEEFDAVLSDVRMPGVGGIELCRKIHDRTPDVPVVLLTGFGSFETAVAAIRAGAYDFLSKPAKLDAVEIALARAVEHHRLSEEVRRLRRAIDPSEEVGLLGEAPPMRELKSLIARVADADVSVLVTGESGTGKEVVARAIHAASSRRDQPFVAINCAAVPESLLESELFGHVRGAFTDAREARAGLFRRAHGGTLLLDEIGDMPLGIQPKLLRVLQERVVRPVGGAEEVPVDVRIIASTHRDLEALMEQQRFREDLYFRIHVVEVEVPPLRARKVDILPLAQRFLRDIAKRLGREVQGISTAAAERLVDYSWPGNVRELQNCIERAVALTRFDHLAVEDLPERVRQHGPEAAMTIPGDDPAELPSMDEVERRYVLHVLDAMRGNKAAAARILGFERKTLYRKLERWGVPIRESDR